MKIKKTQSKLLCLNCGCPTRIYTNYHGISYRYCKICNTMHACKKLDENTYKVIDMWQKRKHNRYMEVEL